MPADLDSIKTLYAKNRDAYNPIKSSRRNVVEIAESTYIRRPVVDIELRPNFTDRFAHVEIGEIHVIPDSVKYGLKGNFSYFLNSHSSGAYQIEDDFGINTTTFGLRDSDILLAKYAQKVSEEMQTSGNCYTGVKHALWDAGIIADYADMPKGSANLANEYFDEHPEMFEKIEFSREDLKKLPAGVILVYEKNGEHGHISITNGNGQEYSDSCSNMGWLDKHGEGSTVVGYRLTDGWCYNPDTKKLDFTAN